MFITAVCVVLLITGADPGFQKGGGGGWMADHIY